MLPDSKCSTRRSYVYVSKGGCVMWSTSAVMAIMVGLVRKLRARWSIRRLAYSGAEEMVTLGGWEMLLVDVVVDDVEGGSWAVVDIVMNECMKEAN